MASDKAVIGGDEYDNAYGKSGNRLNTMMLEEIVPETSGQTNT